MTTIVETKKNGQQNTPDRVDIAVSVYNKTRSDNNGKVEFNANKNLIFAAKAITFNQNTPKSPIQILGLSNPAGYARDPENRTFSLSELLLFDKLDNLRIFISTDNGGFADTPFQIEIEVSNTKADNTKETKIITLEDVVFDTSSSAFDSNTSEYTNELSGMFTKMSID